MEPWSQLTNPLLIGHYQLKPMCIPPPSVLPSCPPSAPGSTLHVVVLFPRAPRGCDGSSDFPCSSGRDSGVCVMFLSWLHWGYASWEGQPRRWRASSLVPARLHSINRARCCCWCWPWSPALRGCRPGFSKAPPSSPFESQSLTTAHPRWSGSVLLPTRVVWESSAWAVCPRS